MWRKLYLMIVGRWLAAAVYENIIVFGTGLIVALIFACRGGVSPPDFLGLSKAPTPTDLCEI